MDKSRLDDAAASDGSPPPAISVLLVEDDAMVRKWLQAVLEASEFRLCGIASTAAEGLELARGDVHVVLVDQRLPDRAGTELVQELRLRGVRAPAVVMTANEERGLNELAREAGAQGTVLKDGSPELLGALRAVVRGEQAFDSRHPRREPGGIALTPRERAVLQLVAAGQTNTEIALALEVSSETVRTLVQGTFEKLGARRRAEAVATAQALGLL